RAPASNKQWRGERLWKKFTTRRPGRYAMSQTVAKSPNPFFDALRSLHNVKIGGVSSNPAKTKVKRKDLAFILANLSTLLENGVSLPRALETLAREASLKKYAFMLE